MKKTFQLLALSSVLLLTACGSGGFMKDLDLPELKLPKFFSKSSIPDNDPVLKDFSKKDCPALVLQPDLLRFQEYINPTQPSPQSKIGEIAITKVETLCQLNQQSVIVRLGLEFQGALGAQGIKDSKVEANYSYPYFVAVVAPNGQILSKDVFAMTLTYKSGQTTQKTTDILQQTIPLPAGIAPQSYQILVGFQLSPAELALNRQR